MCVGLCIKFDLVSELYFWIASQGGKWVFVNKDVHVFFFSFGNENFSLKQLICWSLLKTGTLLPILHLAFPAKHGIKNKIQDKKKLSNPISEW